MRLPPTPRIPRFPEPAATSSVTLSVSPSDAYAVVGDPVAMVGLAEEAHRARWTGGATGTRVGARFRGYNRNGRHRWATTCRITDAEPGRRLAYEVTAPVLGIPLSRWQYDIEPAADGGCTVTETNWVRVPLWFTPFAALISGVTDRVGANNAHIDTTLDRLKAHLEKADTSAEPTPAPGPAPARKHETAAGRQTSLPDLAAAAVRWGISQRLPRTVLRLGTLRGDPIARITLQPQRADRFAVFDGLRRRGPVVLTPGLGAVPGHAAANSVLRSDQFGVGGGHGELPDWLRRLLERSTRDEVRGPMDPPSMLAVDPPQHTRYRRQVSRAFTPRHVAALEEQVTSTAAQLLDGLEGDAKTGFDLVERYSSLLPVAVIGDLLGVRPADRPDLLRWGDAAVLLLDPGLTWRRYREAERGVLALYEWFTRHVRRLRADPGDDLLSRLAVLDGDDALDEVELRSVGLLVLGAGFETTVSLISNAVALFDRHPGQLAAVRDDPGRWANAVDEVLRFDSPVQMTLRVAYEDTAVEGVGVSSGQALLVLLAAANRDPAVFDDPNRFDVNRRNAADHIAFSSGVHYCLGAGLARLEARVALRMLYERFPDLRVTGQPQRRQTRVLRGFARLPVAAAR